MAHDRVATRSQQELKRLIEEAVRVECELAGRGLWLCVDHVEVYGYPPERLKVWATLHFSAGGAPFCCGEPECQLGLIERGWRVSESVRTAMGLRQRVDVEFGDRITTQYHSGVTFTHSPNPPTDH